MGAKASATEFFKAGGTLHPDSPSYIKRPADDELFQQVMTGQFCYILTSRQRGKSSLMIRTAERLRSQGIRTAIVDLSGLGTQVTREQWYLGIVKRLAIELRLPIDPEGWWRERGGIGPVQRFTDFLHDAVLAEITGRVVIFIDEIDSTLKLDFTDDFFAAIRVLYNLRASDPSYDRLTFVLLGVAAPTDLIKDRNRTPFNIGYAIDLQEFSRDDARPLQDALEQLYPGQGRRILDRVFYWTNGHPYLTQRICLEIAEAPNGGWEEGRIDQLIRRLFLAEEARKESNLQFVRSSVEASPERHHLVRLYRRVYQGERVVEDERSALQKRLKLIGLVRSEGGVLHVRNQIYRQVFDLPWINANTPINWTRIVTIGAAVVSILALGAAIVFIQAQQKQALAIRLQTLTEGFHGSGDADVKMNYLVEVCQIDQGAAQQLFFEQPNEDQLDAFNHMNTENAAAKLRTVIECLYPTLPKSVQRHEQVEVLVRAMCGALYRSDPTTNEPICANRP